MIRLAALDHAMAVKAWSSRHCFACKKTKVRDIEPLCKKCIAELPETVQKALRDPKLYPAAFTSALKILRKSNT